MTTSLLIVGDSHTHIITSTHNRPGTLEKYKHMKICFVYPARILPRLTVHYPDGTTGTNPLLTEPFRVAGWWNYATDGFREECKQRGVVFVLGSFLSYRFGFHIGWRTWRSGVSIENRRFISPQLIVEEMDRQLLPLLEALTYFRQNFQGRIALFPGPPPHPEPDSRLPAWGQHLIPTPHTSQIVWLQQLLSSRFAHICAEAGVDYLDSPPKVKREDGLLNEEYCGDGVHANTAFGLAALEHIDQWWKQGSTSI